MAFCPNCGKEVSPQAFACPNCGHPLRTMKPPLPPSERVSALWWLLPLFFVLIGGIVSYLLLRDRNRKTATYTLVFGLVWTFLWPFVLLGMVGLTSVFSAGP